MTFIPAEDIFGAPERDVEEEDLEDRREDSILALTICEVAHSWYRR